MRNGIYQVLLVGGLMLIMGVLAACQPIEAASDSQLVETIVTQTLAADQTQQSPVDVPTVTPTPTNSSEPVATEEPMPTPTQETTEDDPCNQGAFVTDITIEDRTIITKGASFTKTWRLKNTGTCAWTTDYQVVFSSGSQMGAPATSRLPRLVQPGETVDISLKMVAPDSSGTFTGYWLILADPGQAFGIGEDADAPFWVRIRVVDKDVLVVYNFAENYCDANWISSVEDDIGCPSEEDLEEGFVQFTDQPHLEDGISYAEPAILTYPDHGRSGYLVGRFPITEIEDGFHFRATIGCQFGADNCDVRYTLRVHEQSSGLTTLGEWREVYEGLYYPIDVDLSDFAGKEVSILLSVIAQDDTRENYALWLDPHIVVDAKVPQPGPSPIDTEDDEYVALYNLADHYCLAGWESSVAQQIQCPSSEDLDQGFIQIVDRPRLEDGKIYQDPAILTYPDHGRSGYMVGRFPRLTIQEGDLFRAALGCQFGAGTCDIRYTLRGVLPPGGGLDSLGQWRIVYNGSVYHAEVDLSDYAGEEIELVLSVIAQDDSHENYALWVNPRVIREISE